MSVCRHVARAARVALAAPLLAAVAAAPPQDPVLRILEPLDGAIVTGAEVTIRLQVEGAELGGQARNAAHVLLTLDAMPPLKSLGPRFTFRGVDAGDHSLRAELRRRDGSAFEPPVVARGRFRVVDSGH